MQTTALIHEAYIKLIDQEDVRNGKTAHIFLRLRRRRCGGFWSITRANATREKRGGNAENLPLEEAAFVISQEKSVDLVALDEALTRLAKFDERQARVVELRYFSGLSIDETAEVLGISNVTVRRDWNMAKAWLHGQISK